jgi:hypothetical protein
MSLTLTDYPTLLTYTLVANQPITAANSTTITGGNYGSSANPTSDIHLEPQSPAVLDNGQHATTALTESIALFDAIDSAAYTTIGTNITTPITFTPAKYYSASAITFSGVTITLDAENNSDAKFYIEAYSAITFANVTAIELINGAQAKNVFWVTKTAAISFTGTSPPSIPGIFIAHSAITFETASMIYGILVAQIEKIDFQGGASSIVSPIDSDGGGTVCYAKGTLILTKNGYVPIEDMKAGQHIITKGKIHQCSHVKEKDSIQHVVWISKFKLKHLNSKTKPICIQKNAFGSMPFQDLYVSPDHSLVINGKMVRAKRLLNGTTIHQPDCSEVTYYHLECYEHTAIVANGVIAESYLELNNRRIFEHSLKYKHKITPLTMRIS